MDVSGKVQVSLKGQNNNFKTGLGGRVHEKISESNVHRKKHVNICCHDDVEQFVELPFLYTYLKFVSAS